MRFIYIITFLFIMSNSIIAQKDFSYMSDTYFIDIKRIDGKYKLSNTKKDKFLSSNSYDYICPNIYTFEGAKNNVYIVKSGLKYGLVDSVTGEEIVSPEDSEITNFEERIYFPNEEPLVWKANYKEIKIFSAPIYIRNLSHSRPISPYVFCYSIDPKSYTCAIWKIGYCEVSTGKIIIPPIFDNVESDRYGFYDYVTLNKKKGVVTTEGKQIIECKYNAVRRLHDGFIVEIRNEEGALYGLINKSGEQILPPKFKGINNFSQTPIKYKTLLNNKVGIYNDKGQIIIPCKYDNIFESVNPDIIIISDNNKWGLITSKNKTLIKPSIFDAVSVETTPEGDVFFGALKGKWGLITKYGKILLSPKYDEITHCREVAGYFVVSLEGKWFQIDSKGNIIQIYDKNPYEIKEDLIEIERL